MGEMQVCWRRVLCFFGKSKNFVVLSQHVSRRLLNAGKTKMSCRKLDPAEWADLQDTVKKMPSKSRIVGAGHRVLASYAKHYPTYNVIFFFFAFFGRKNFFFWIFFVFFSFLTKISLINWDIFTATCVICGLIHLSNLVELIGQRFQGRLHL